MKVNVQNAKSFKHYKHPIANDVNTSAEWGHMQPVLVRELIGNSKNTLQQQQIVRMMPIVLPTFGRITLNTYNVFVPFETIFHPYASFRGQQTYMGANATYIPNQVLAVRPAFFDLVCKYMSTVQVFKCVGTEGFPVILAQQQLTYVSLENVATPERNAVISSYESSLQLKFGWSVFPTLFSDSYLGNYRQFKTPSSPPLSLDGFDWFVVTQVTVEGSYYLICGNYHESARNFRKVLYGCGFKLVDDFEYVSVLPVMAYYKAYFDLFYPKRSLTWKDSPQAGIQEWCEQYGRFNIDADDTGVLFQKYELVFDWIIALCSTYYTQSPDFVSSHITGQRLDIVQDFVFPSMSPDGTNEVITGTLRGSNTGVGSATVSDSSIYNDVPIQTYAAQRLLNPQNVDILQRIYHRINSKTAIGADLRTFLKTQLGVDYLDEDETYWIGSHKLDINITPVFSNAETEKGVLGDFAAQGSGGASHQTLTYEAKVDGFWISMAAIVPESRFSQAMDMNLKHVRLKDFFDHQYDSLTLLPTHKKYIFAELDMQNQVTSPNSAALNSSFGNMPNYIEYCTGQNIVNGDMSLRSKRSYFLPFTLDKLLPYTRSHAGNGSTTPSTIINTGLSVIVNSDIWRYIGLYKWIGNFDRIFVNSGTEPHPESIVPRYNNMFYSTGYDDNFIIHHRNNLTMWNSKLPCQDAFQTGAFDEGSISIEKA